MNDNELKALISLLDDEDPEVSEHVWSKLISLGKDGIDRLETEWEVQEDPLIQERIEELISSIHRKEVTKGLLNWRKGGGKDLLEGWLLLTRFFYPEMDVEARRNAIKRLVNMTWLEVNQKLLDEDKIAVLNHVLFVLEGFRPVRRKDRSPNNYFVNFVLDQKRGTLYGLGLLYLIIAQKLDFPVGGVILPGYFVLYLHRGEDEGLFIDVYNGGNLFSREDLEKFLEKIKVKPKSTYFKPTSNIYIMLEMIRMLAAEYQRGGDHSKAEALTQLLKDIDITFD